MTFIDFGLIVVSISLSFFKKFFECFQFSVSQFNDKFIRIVMVIKVKD